MPVCGRQGYSAVAHATSDYCRVIPIHRACVHTRNTSSRQQLENSRRRLRQRTALGFCCDNVDGYPRHSHVFNLLKSNIVYDKLVSNPVGSHTHHVGALKSRSISLRHGGRRRHTCQVVPRELVTCSFNILRYTKTRVGVVGTVECPQRAPSHCKGVLTCLGRLQQFTCRRGSCLEFDGLFRWRPQSSGLQCVRHVRSRPLVAPIRALWTSLQRLA